MEPFQQAYQQLQNGNVASGTEQIAALWKANPTDFELAYAAGTALDSTGHHREATGWYLKALKINPRFGPACNNLALNYASQGEFQKAVPLLQRVTQLEPRNANAFYNLGLVHLQLKHFPYAVQALARASELKPGDRDWLLRLAYASLMAGERQRAMLCLETVLKLPGDASEALLPVVQVLSAAGQYRQALEQIRKGNIAVTSSPGLSYEEANALFHLGEYKQAAEVLMKSPAAKERGLDYYLLLGSSRALGGDLPGAVETLQMAVRTAPQRPEPYHRLALVFLDGYRDQEAGDVLATGLKLIPNSSLLLYTQGIVNEVDGRYQNAVDDMRKSLEAENDQPEVWASLGELYTKIGNYDEAAKAYQHAMEQGAAPEAAVTYADLLIRLQRFAEAEKLVRRAMESRRTMPQAYLSLGKLYSAQQRYADAEKALKRAIELDPDDATAHALLAVALQQLGRAQEAQSESNLATQKRELARQRERAAVLRGVLVPREGSAPAPSFESAVQK
jgi:tetratricopeptide (TPR) repeat protein